jgi:isoquinoline 1-oxidoreductase alpha subunit
VAYTVKINGKAVSVDATGDTPLLWALRDTLGMVGTKYGCGVAQCGACTVHMNGKPVRACMMTLQSLPADASITTIEGVGADPVGKKVQQAWAALDVAQCGYCQAGQIMSATALLKSNPNPSDADINSAMAGNICRCATYLRIRAAIKQAAATTEKVNG